MRKDRSSVHIWRNALMIAAAPCLLEACELVLAYATIEFPEELLAGVKND